MALGPSLTPLPAVSAPGKGRQGGGGGGTCIGSECPQPFQRPLFAQAGVVIALIRKKFWVAQVDFLELKKKSKAFKILGKNLNSPLENCILASVKKKRQAQNGVTCALAPGR